MQMERIEVVVEVVPLRLALSLVHEELEVNEVMGGIQPLLLITPEPEDEGLVRQEQILADEMQHEHDEMVRLIQYLEVL